MFQFSAFPPHYAVPGDKPWAVSRSRTSSDHGLLSGSPKLIAAMLRPSSALDAKASTMHSSELNQCFLNRDMPRLIRFTLFSKNPRIDPSPDRSEAVRLSPSPHGPELVEATGLEPTTAWLQTRCSTN